MKKQTVTGFDFQVIPMEDAQRMVLAGRGLYANIKEAILEKLPTLKSDQSFVFGLPNGKEIPEDQYRGICIAVNLALKKQKSIWRVIYNSSKKLFVMTPSARKYTRRTKAAKGE